MNLIYLSSKRIIHRVNSMMKNVFFFQCAMNSIIFICTSLLFVFAENAPTSTSTSDSNSCQERDVTEAINGYFSVIFKVLSETIQNSSNPPNNVNYYPMIQSENGLLHNVTARVQQSSPAKFQFIYGDVFEVRTVFENALVTVKGYLRSSNNSIATESFLLNLYETASEGPNNSTIDYHDIDQQNIKLLTNDHTLEPSTENQLVKEFKSLLKSSLLKLSSGTNETAVKMKEVFSKTPGFNTFLQHNTQKHYYFINSIPSIDLRNVSIKGLWNIHNITAEPYNPEPLVNIQMSGVQGTMMQTISSKNGKPTRLSFNADSISVLGYQNPDKNSFKLERYSVAETESNKPLSNDQSELIIERIESVIMISIRESAKNATVVEKYSQICGL